MRRVAGVVSIALAITLSLFSGAIARADDVQIEGVTITQNDLLQLLGALHKALQPDDMTVPVVIVVKKPGEMPSYDARSHYAGIGPDKSGASVLHIWVNGDLKSADVQDAIESSFILAITDGGYAGPAFKKLYDTYAQQDAQLPANSPDPFLNRHRFAAALTKLVGSSQK